MPKDDTHAMKVHYVTPDGVRHECEVLSASISGSDPKGEPMELPPGSDPKRNITRMRAWDEKGRPVRVGTDAALPPPPPGGWQMGTISTGEGKMPGEMIERLVRAIRAEARNQDVIFEYDEEDDPAQFMMYTGASFDLPALARTILDAIREPTEKMLKAAYDAQGYDGDFTIRRWQAMIDEALKEK